MKKVLEVLQYGETDLRFNTDFDVKKNPDAIAALVLKIAMAMGTSLWGGNEQSVLAVLRAMTVADLALTVNRKELIQVMEHDATMLARALERARKEFVRAGGEVQVFGPGVASSGHRS